MTEENRWTVRDRARPNGDRYWVVMRGGTAVLTRRPGGAEFASREQAEDAARLVNGEEPR